jgi:hypothetical protein
MEASVHIQQTKSPGLQEAKWLSKQELLTLGQPKVF